MRQVLFYLPFHALSSSLPDIPVYGYGAMLFLAFVFCTWLASWLGKPYGISKEVVQDLAIWLFVSGILGARLTFLIQYSEHFTSFGQFFAVWDGGLVFYGSFIGGAAGFLLAQRYLLSKHGIGFWQMADIVAPCAALGLCLGRVGCLLNGCCYGNVACPDCSALAYPPSISFPLSAAPRYDMTRKGYQTAAGFLLEETPLDRRTVARVEKGSAADRAGLREGDVIVKAGANDLKDIDDYNDLVNVLVKDWPKGENHLTLVVRRPGAGQEVTLAFVPWSIGLHPTQIYESISMALLLLLLLAYLPFRQRAGHVMALFMICYAVHRFLNEILRVDTEPFADGLSLSQNLSVPIFVAGVAIWIWLWRLPVRPASGPGPINGQPMPEAACGLAR